MRPSPRLVKASDHESPHPIYIVWELTLKCDQACRHCGSRAGVARREELDTGEALALARAIPGLGVRAVTLIGGEAYLRADWHQIAATLAAAGVEVSLVTGGRGLTERVAEQAAAAGLTSVSVSIDGLQATHDRLRAVPNSHAAAMAALQAVRAQGIQATVNTQINRANLHELDRMADVFLAESGPLSHPLASWQLQLTTPMGRAADQDRLILQPYDLLDLMPELARLAARCQARGCRLFFADNIGYFGPYEEILRPEGHWTGCTGGSYTLGITSDGRLKACGSLPTPPYDGPDVRSGDLAHLIATSPALARVRDRTNFGTSVFETSAFGTSACGTSARGTDESDLSGYCAECHYGPVCRGGCTWTGHVLLGRPGNMPYCFHRADMLRREGVRERLVREREAPGLPFDHGVWSLIEEPLPERQAPG